MSVYVELFEGFYTYTLTYLPTLPTLEKQVHKHHESKDINEATH